MFALTAGRAAGGTDRRSCPTFDFHLGDTPKRNPQTPKSSSRTGAVSGCQGCSVRQEGWAERGRGRGALRGLGRAAAAAEGSGDTPGWGLCSQRGSRVSSATPGLQDGCWGLPPAPHFGALWAALEGLLCASLLCQPGWLCAFPPSQHEIKAELSIPSRLGGLLGTASGLSPHGDTAVTRCWPWHGAEPVSQLGDKRSFSRVCVLAGSSRARQLFLNFSMGFF